MMLELGAVVLLDCDAERPRRPHVVVRVDDQGAWLQELESYWGPWCIGVNAGHQRVDQQQAALW